MQYSSNESDDGDDASIVRHGRYYPFWKMEARTLSTQVIANATIIGFFFLFGFLVVGDGVVVLVGL
jgi:hypothetical protein